MNIKILSAITILALVIFALFPEIDLKVTHFFFFDGQFPLRGNVSPLHNVGSLALDYTVRICCILSALICLGAIVFQYTRKFIPAVLQNLGDKLRSYIKFTNKQLKYLFLVIVITPGIIVHWVMKPIWERARPVNVTEFGGEKTYTTFYHLHAHMDGNSFPSGHAAMAFALVALGYMVAPEKRKKVLFITICYAILASACRVWQGSHFISDVTFSGLLTLWTIIIMDRLYLSRK